MYDQPSIAELVGAVRDFIEQHAMSKLEGHTAFHARVAVNALGIVQRQLELGPTAEEAERERLAGLLGMDGDLEALNRELCRRIRAGETGIEDEALTKHLWRTTLDKVAVDQPKYESYRRAVERERGQGPKELNAEVAEKR